MRLESLIFLTGFLFASGAAVCVVSLSDIIAPQVVPLPVSSVMTVISVFVGLSCYPWWLAKLKAKTRNEGHVTVLAFIGRLFFPVSFLRDSFSSLVPAGAKTGGFLYFGKGVISLWYFSFWLSILVFAGGILQFIIPGFGLHGSNIALYGILIAISWGLSSLLFCLMMALFAIVFLQKESVSDFY